MPPTHIIANKRTKTSPVLESSDEKLIVLK